MSKTRGTRLKRGSPLAIIVASAALLIAPATGSAFRFGALLTTDTQPSNAGSGQPCQVGPGACTWAQQDAYGRPDGGHKSPFTGKLRKVRLIAQSPGSFRLQIVKTRQLSGNNYEGKLVATGPRIIYKGQSDPDALTYTIETFTLKDPIPIKKGQSLAIKTANTSMLRCSGGGNNTLLFQPPLFGSAFTPYDDGDGCFLLIEGIGKKKQ